MIRRSAAFAVLTLAGCNSIEPAISPTSAGTATVERGELGGLELELLSASGAKLAVSCRGGDASIYLDTKVAPVKPPALAGVYGNFGLDGEDQLVELSWPSSPPSAWMPRQESEEDALARAIIRATRVTFKAAGPADPGTTIDWSVDLTDKDRAAIKNECR